MVNILLDQDGYVTSYATLGEFEGGIDVTIDPEDLEHFENNYECYRIEENTLVYDEEHSTAVNLKHQQESIRTRRRTICFPIVNRGNVWYRTLTNEQSEELYQWYLNWLDAPNTLQEPELLDWLQSEEIIEK